MGSGVSNEARRPAPEGTGGAGCLVTEGPLYNG
jgi:hypothetical protein